MSVEFATPWLLALLPLVPLIAASRMWAGNRSAAALRYAHNSLATPPKRTWRVATQPALTGLRLLALALIIVAVARPQTSEATQIINGTGVDIALALDISGSMASLDFAPQNRLGAAKSVIGDFVEARPYDRIGLVVFASQAFIQGPPTIDHDVLQVLLTEVELVTDLGLDDGTAIGLGLASAANMLRESTAESKVIILLTDGANNAGNIDPITAALAIEALGIKVYAIGAGRPGIVQIPQRTRFGTRIVRYHSDLDEEVLTKIASTTGGQYFHAENAAGLEQIYEEINRLEKSELDVQVFTRYEEKAIWLLLPALVMLLGELALRNTLLRRLP